MVKKIVCPFTPTALAFVVLSNVPILVFVLAVLGAYFKIIGACVGLLLEDIPLKIAT